MRCHPIAVQSGRGGNNRLAAIDPLHVDGSEPTAKGDIANFLFELFQHSVPLGCRGVRRDFATVW